MAFVSVLTTSRNIISGHPKSVLKRHLRTLLGFQNYELLDYLL